MSRKRIIALLTAFAALAAILSACGGGGGGSGENAEKVIEDATFEGVESGEIGFHMTVKAEGEEPGEIKIDLAGPFQSTGKGSLPELAMTASATGEAKGQNIDFEGGVTLLGDRAYVAYEDKNYEVDPTTFGFIKSGFEQAVQEGENESAGGEATACQKEASSLDLGEFVNNLENEGGEEVDGVETTKLSGDLDPKSSVEAIVKLLESPACSSELEAAGPLPLSELKEQESELTGAIKKAHVEIYVGEEDHIPRKVVAELSIEPKGGSENGDVDLEFTLGKVNEKQTIKAPAGAEPIEKLFEQLGVNPLELLGAGGGAGGLGELLEGLSGGSSSSGEGSSNTEELGLPSTSESKEFTECLDEAESAADVQKCATLME